MNWTALKTKMLALTAAMVVCATGFGVASMQTAEPQKATADRANQPAKAAAEGAPIGMAPKVLEITPNADGKVTVPVLRTQTQHAPPAPPGGVRPHFVKLNRVVENVELADVKDLKITTVLGKKVSTEDAVKALAKGGVVVVAGDGNNVSPWFLKIFKNDVLVLAAPELAAALNAPQPAPGGGAAVPPPVAPAPPVPAPK